MVSQREASSSKLRLDYSSPSGILIQVFPSRNISEIVIKPALLVILFLLWSICPATQVHAAVADSVVTIYVEDNNGSRIATGNGLLIARDGTIATDTRLVLAWLEADDNSLILRAGKSGYYPLETLLTVDRKLGIALFRIDAGGLRPAALDPEYVLSAGEAVSVVGSPEGIGIEVVDGTVKDVLDDGQFEISIQAEKLMGVPVLNQHGKVVAIASMHDGKGVAVPVSDVLPMMEKSGGAGQNGASADMAIVKRAKAAVNAGRADAGDYFRLGVAYTKAGMADRAIDAFKEAIKLKPEFAEAYQGLGVSYASEKLHKEAIEALSKAVSIRPDYAEAFSNLGFLYDYLGRHEEAVAAFRKALTLRPDYAEAHNGLGVSFARARNYEEAIESFQRALRIRPESKKARFNLALSYVSLGDRKSALHQERLLRDIDPELADRLLDFIPPEELKDESPETEYAKERPENEDPLN